MLGEMSVGCPAAPVLSSLIWCVVSALCTSWNGMTIMSIKVNPKAPAPKAPRPQTPDPTPGITVCQSGADVDYKDDHVSVIAIGESTEERPVAD